MAMAKSQQKFGTKHLSQSFRKIGDGMLRSSSLEDQDMTPAKIESILVNNKYFPHLYDPYYDRSDVKSHLIEYLKPLKTANREAATGPGAALPNAPT